MAIPGGIEPPTPCLEGRCSIRLSYGTGTAYLLRIGRAGKGFCQDGGKFCRKMRPPQSRGLQLGQD